MSNIPVITIDGPGGSGKGTLARLLARELGWHILDSGAIYRVLAVAAQQGHISPDNEADLAKLAENIQIEFLMDDELHMLVKLDQQVISEAIREETIGNLASKISVYPLVRAALLQKQRDFRQVPGLVTDGRDMGTVVFPDADIKIFLQACPKIRAERRYKQLKTKGIDVNLAQILDEIKERDRRDQERPIAPLKAADDSIIVDSSELSIQEAFAQVLDIVKQRLRVS